MEGPKRKQRSRGALQREALQHWEKQARYGIVKAGRRKAWEERFGTGVTMIVLKRKTTFKKKSSISPVQWKGKGSHEDSQCGLKGLRRGSLRGRRRGRNGEKRPDEVNVLGGESEVRRRVILGLRLPN